MTKVHSKEADDKLFELKSDGSNWTPWIEALEAKTQSMSGTISNFIVTGKLTPRPIPDKDQICAKLGLDCGSHSATRIFEGSLIEYQKSITRDEDTLIQLFGMIKQYITPAGMEKMKQDDGWNALQISKCPNELLLLVKRIHNLNAYNVPPEEAREMAFERYYDLEQGKLTLMGYKEHEQLAIDNMEYLKYNPMPNEEARAHRFLRKLNLELHGSYVREIVNGSRSVPPIPLPKTIQAIVTGAKCHVSIGSIIPDFDKRLAYTVQVRHCNYCKRDNHLEENCYHKKKVEREKAKKEQEASDGPTPDTGVKTTKKTGKKTKFSWQKNKKGANVGDKKDKIYKSIFNFYSQDLAFDYETKIYTSTAELCNKFHHNGDIQEDDIWYVIYDSGANHCFGCNIDLMHSIMEKDFTFEGVGGVSAGHAVGILPGFGEMAYTPDSGVNAIAGCAAETRYLVEFKQLENYIVHVNVGFQLEFNYDKQDRLYKCKFDPDILKKLKNLESKTRLFVATVREQESKFNKKEIQRAKASRTLMRRLAYPGETALVKTLTKGSFLNCPTTGKDVVLAFDIYGHDVALLGGKMKDYGPVGNYQVLVPRMEQKEQQCFCDIFVWRQVPHLIFVLQPLGLVLTLIILIRYNSNC